MAKNVEALVFYMLGREKPLDDEFDIEELATRVMNGENVRDVARAAAAAADLPKKTPENRKVWGRKRDIREALGLAMMDEATAYGHYHDGVIDQTAFELEPEVLEVVDEMLGEDDEIPAAEPPLPS